MKLSIVIVNYNVKHFLEQCLHSVFASAGKLDCEVFVVDNNSVDGSVAMVKSTFPSVKLIANKVNTGFSVANNQAIKEASGQYILLLNPDTVVEEDTFEKVTKFMDSHPDCGGLGVKMIDGKGRFLPESKRGLPVPSVAFWKLSGLSRIFPKSRIFGRYHLGFLDKNQVHEVDVLSGAFMLLRKETLDKTGLLDENFFMYGEDIDLSYRICQSGYKNYYFPETTIIHYKGESTRKGSLNYVLVFYRAMLIFARKHFTASNARTFSLFIGLAIWFRASLSLFSRIVKSIALPVADAAIIFGGFAGAKYLWEHYKFGEHNYYPESFIYYVVPAYVAVLVFSVYYLGGYSRPLKLFQAIKGIVAGTLLVLVIYALLSESMRFSRAIVLMGTGTAFISIPIMRTILHLTGVRIFRLHRRQKKRIVIAGNDEECARVQAIIESSKLHAVIVGRVNTGTANGKNLGSITQLKDVVRVHRVDEIIFCSADIPSQEVIRNMMMLSELNIDYKIAGPGTAAVIGSNSIDTAGDLYSVNLNSIATGVNRRNKRLFDIVFSVLLLIFSPLLIFVIPNPGVFLANMMKSLAGVRTLIGYAETEEKNHSLPALPKGILAPVHPSILPNLSTQQIEQINLVYAKDYKAGNDLTLLFRGIKHLGKG